MMLCILSLRLLDSMNIIINKQPGQDQNQAAALMPVRVPPLFFYLLSAVVSAELHRNGGGDFCGAEFERVYVAVQSDAAVVVAHDLLCTQSAVPTDYAVLPFFMGVFVF